MGGLALPAPRKGTVLGLCIPLRAIIGTSLLLTLFQVNVLMMLFQSNHLTPHMLLQYLKLNYVLPNHLSLTIAYLFFFFFLQWPQNNEPTISRSI